MKTVLGSLTRITDFEQRPPEIRELPRRSWARGDYLMVEMLEDGPESYEVETTSGEPEPIFPGDRLIGALGTRAATLEVVGDWREISEDLEMQTLTAAGVLGVCTSAALQSAVLANVRYVGHAFRDGERCTMKSFVTPVEPGSGGSSPGPTGPTGSGSGPAPVILVIGTSMDSGKTIAAVAMIRELVAMGKRVTGAKVTGVGRYRDILAMERAGASPVMDFVDVGLPSTVVPPSEYRESLDLLCSKLAAGAPDVVIVEAGASPLEPYCGEVAMKVLSHRVKATVLCASDPYAVLGVTKAFGRKPDLVAGRATSTEAGIDLIDKLVGAPALNLIDRSTGPELSEFLSSRLGY
jgi:hypothetical protein